MCHYLLTKVGRVYSNFGTAASHFTNNGEKKYKNWNVSLWTINFYRCCMGLWQHSAPADRCKCCLQLVLILPVGVPADNNLFLVSCYHFHESAFLEDLKTSILWVNCKYMEGQTNSTELWLHWEANSCLATQGIISIKWNPKVHYHVHTNSPLDSILSQNNPVYILHAIYIRTSLILSSHVTYVFLVVSFLQGFPPKFCVHFFSLPYLLRALFIVSSLILSFEQYLATIRPRNFEACHYELFCSVLSLDPSWVQIFSSAEPLVLPDSVFETVYNTLFILCKQNTWDSILKGQNNCFTPRNTVPFNKLLVLELLKKLPTFYTTRPIKLAPSVTLLTRIREVPGSNRGQDIGYSDRGFLWFS
jgi:hypothetical protein